ncbi:sodium-dependent neutral amino acid transporter B(0)AT3-like [Zootoca vivipara]|uniref:sodium-dependent neutral amino acid transporter B(0)AT3-like n=1 Tax=Zootoca vivipara TaxID=8524 RepID=UPI00293BEC66|nr:sodium-dependent neutral amino acid transporter B(0)AT3-like [Zootoca vivipara]
MATDEPEGSVEECKDKRARPKWDSKFQYLLSCAGFVVGLGNVWRFPYLCQTYGGGAFLIPYLIAFFLEGTPIFFLELAIGQRMKKGSIQLWWHISPYLGGLGYTSLIVCFLVILYYNMLLAWILWYFINSFRNPLPWSSCPTDTSKPELIEECHKSTPTNYFWYRYTLNISTDIGNSGPLQWWLVLCLAACWLIVFICTVRGIESTGKAIYFTATFPYLILTIFLIYGLTLPGAIHGLVYFMTPNLKKIKNPRAWLDAATQIFFSLSLGLGGLIAYSSYNPSNNDCELDAVMIASINSLTSLFASIPIFSILGYKAKMAHEECLASIERKVYNPACSMCIFINSGIQATPFLCGGCVPGQSLCINLFCPWPAPIQSKLLLFLLGTVAMQIICIIPDFTDRNVKYITKVFRNDNITVDSGVFWLSYLNGTDINKLAALNQTNCDLQHFLDQSVSGTGLSFIVFTEIMLKMPGTNIWGILFFFMLFNLGISSMFGLVQSVLTPLTESHIVSRYIRKEVVCGLICLTAFLLGLVFTLRSGSYWLEMVDSYVATLPLLIIALFEVVGIVFIYGMKRISADVEDMTGRPLNCYWKATWQFFSPGIMFMIFVSYVLLEAPSSYNTWNPNYVNFPAKESKKYPTWAVTISIMLESVPCLMIPFGAIYQLWRIVLKKKQLQITHPDTSTGST